MSLQCLQRSNNVYLILLIAAYMAVLVNQTSLAPEAVAETNANRKNSLQDFVQQRKTKEKKKYPISNNRHNPPLDDHDAIDQLTKGRDKFSVPSLKRQEDLRSKEPEDDLRPTEPDRHDEDVHALNRQPPNPGVPPDPLGRSFEHQEDYRQCAYNRPFPRPEHGCVVDPVTEIPYCQMDNMRLDVDKISMTAGGEALDTVMGQAEDIEFPKIEKGAFQLLKPLNMTATNRRQFYYIKDVVNNIEVVKGASSHQPCSKRIPGVTLFITRYEYCNAYHTMTDWFNAFLAHGELKNATVVLLDAHPQGKLDPVWSTLWGDVLYAKQLPPGGVCFDHVTLIPPGYSSPLWARGRKFEGIERCPSMMDSFAQFFVDGHGLQDIQRRQGKVTIIDRVPYIAHPRSKPKVALRMVQNFEELATVIRQEVKGVTEVEVVRFEQMTFHEQLKTIRETHILIGNHGAGMAHMLLMQDGTSVMEFQQMASSMFVEFSHWKPKVQHILLPSISGNQISSELMKDSVVPKVTEFLEKQL